MKLLANVLGTLIIITVQSLAVSVVFSALHWLFTKEISWRMFIGGATGIFAVLFANAIYKTAMTMWRFYKYPDFMHANLTTGINWANYQKLKSKNAEE